MGKKIRDEDMVLNIIINGDQGRAELGKLERAVKDLSIANEGLAARKSKVAEQMKKLEKAGRTDTDAYRKLQAEVRQLTGEMERNEASIEQARQRMENLRSGMDITKMTVSDLRREMTRLQKLRNTSVPGTAQWKQYDRELARVVTRLHQVQHEGEATKGALCRMADGVNKYWNLVVSVLASFAGVFFSIKGAVNKFLEFTDVLADTRKTTGLTQQEVEELDKSLEKIDTRSPQEELLGLGRIAGKLGIEGKENIEGFVRAADQINIALKEDLGDNTEEAINHVGKLVDIFRVSENYGIEQGMLKVGSVINELGAASTANEGYIVEFTKRAAGVAPMAGVTVQSVMGLGATLDQFGQQCEASGSVYTKMMTQMYKKTGEFARVAGMEVGAFSKLLKEDANEAFIRVLEGMKGNDAAMESLVANLGDLQLNGVRAATILGTLANHTDVLREQQKLANEAFAEGISLTNEANIKNNNAAAIAAKQRKERDKLIRDLGERLQPVMSAYNGTLNTGLKVLKVLVGFVADYGAALVKNSSAIAWVTAAITAQTVVMKYKISLRSISEKLINRAILLNKAETGSINTLTAAKLLLTNGIKSATTAVRTFFSALMKNPLGLVLTGITLLGVAIYKVVTHMSAAEKVTQRLNEIQKEYRRNLMEEKTQMDYLFDALKKSKEGTDERKTAIKLLNDKYGEYLPNLLTEKSTLEEIEKAQKFANDELVRSLTLKAKKSALEDTAKTYMESYEELYNNFIKRISKGKSDEQKQVIESQINDILNWLKSTKIEYNVDTKELKSTSSEYQALMQKVREFEKRNGKNGTNTKTWMLELLGTTQKMNKELDRQETYYNNIAKGWKTPGEAAKREDPDNKENAGNDKAEIAPDYSGKIIALKESYAAQKITKKEYEKQLDDLELAHLEFRLKNFEGEEEKRRELEEKIADKKIAIREKRNKEETAKEKDKSQEYIDVLLAGNDDLSRKEEAAYRDRLKKAGFFGKERESLTARELAALEVLEKEHQQNLKKIEEDGRKKRQAGYLKEISDEMKRRESENARELLFMQAGHAEEIAAYQGSRARLKALKKKQHKEEMELTEKQANEMISLLEGIFYSAQADELLLGEQMLPEEELENLEKKILEIKKKAAEIKSGMNDAGGENDPDNSVDLLGMTAYQWSEFFKNLEDGKFDIEELIATVGALQSAWGTYDKFKAAQERKELKRYEQKTKKEKAALDRQLDAGKISQEQYNARVSQLDAELDAKKETLERKQAKRKQSMAIIDSIINTAVGVTAALSTQPIWLGIALAAVVGAMGAAETAIIAAQQYAKGKYPVIGGDDGFTYEADYVGDNLQTGVYQKPTLGLFSEKEPEMVVDGATTRKLVFDYPRIYESIMDVAQGRIPQYESGKYPPVAASVSSDPEVAYFSDPEIKSLLRKNIEMMEGLKNMEVVISMYGRNGLQKALKKMNDFERKTTYK